MRWSTDVVGDVAVVRAQGELDELHAPELCELARDLLRDGARNLVIDCQELTFIDSIGLSALIEVHKRAELDLGTVTLRNPTPFMVRLLEITGLDGTLRTDVEGIMQPAAD